jgi:transcriptional repressor NrdR
VRHYRCSHVASFQITRLSHDKFIADALLHGIAAARRLPGQAGGLPGPQTCAARVGSKAVYRELEPMTCPFCGHIQDRVIDSRESKEGDSIRRRRQCLRCEKRFTTYERIDEVPYMVIKKDGRREKFDRQKVLGGLLKASEKRPISVSRLSDLVNEVESKVMDSPEREISTIDIGEYLMDSLKEIDKIAYVRFASVYRNFQDEQAFFNELKNLMRLKAP